MSHWNNHAYYYGIIKEYFDSLVNNPKTDFRSLDSLKKTFELFSGDVIIMSNETQQHWEHRLPKTAESLREKTQPRINLTFRTIYSADDPLFDIA